MTEGVRPDGEMDFQPLDLDNMGGDAATPEPPLGADLGASPDFETPDFAPTEDAGAFAPAAAHAPTDGEAAEKRARRPLMGVPIEIVISVGRARPLLTDLVSLRRDSLIPLDSKIEDPVEIMIGDRVIARGELTEVDGEGRLGVRLTDVADLTPTD